MASKSIQNVSSSFISPALSHWNYDVFLSFRGEDTRKNFTDHLYAALNQRGINVFRDDNELEKGKSISPELFKAIGESRILVIVFSKNYAYSTWCLDELVKIVECKNSSIDQQIVFPIFYDVEPTAVRKQTSSFQEAFAKHEEAFRGNNIERVQKWRDALKEVANISGWELKDRNESEFIEYIVKEISSKLIPTTQFQNHGELVGIESRLAKLMLLINTKSDDVRMIGIWGMGGLGKTTIARVVYDLISPQFEGSSFLADVREISKRIGLISLQIQLLSETLKLRESNIWDVYVGANMIGSRLRRKKVLVVIDDVVDLKQLDSLIGKHDWFGPGSRIIITSRDKHLLMTHGVDQVYKLEELNDDEALQLFYTKAFRTYQPLKEYEDLSKRVVEYADGLPLALRVLGSFLFGRTEEEWKSALKKLKRDSTKDILEILQISFDGLEETEKKIFLDIACFFKGENRDDVIKVLDYCGFDPVIGIAILVEKSLISISENNKLWMHDLLQEMGQQIVKRECPEEPGKRSRLWEEADVHHVLTENTGTEVVEAVIPETEMHLSANARAFTNMTNIRLLIMNNVQLPEGLEYLPKELRLLEWREYPLKSLPANMQLDKICELDMGYSRLKQLWKGIKPFNTLKIMKLSHSKNLIRTPDFTGVPNLEELILEGCTNLCEIHPSLLLHKKLILLSLKGCTSLMNLPSKISMKSLRVLVLSGCLKLRKFPKVVASMECLSFLLLDGTAIKGLPLSVERLSGLVSLILKRCKKLIRLPSNIYGFSSLKILNLSGCSKLTKFPEIERSMECLSQIYLDGTAIKELPLSVELLSGLVFLNLNNCKNLVRLPSTINRLKSLRTLNLSGCSKLENVPENLGKVQSLQYLDISGTAIRQPPSTISLLKNLEELSFRGCKGPPATASWFLGFPRTGLDPRGMRLPSLSGLSSLRELDLSDCNLGEGAIPSDICNLLSLEELNLSKNKFVSLPGAFNRFPKLIYLDLEDCKRLESLPELPSSLWKVRVDGCASLERVLDALKSCKSNWLIIYFVNCLKLEGNIDLVFPMIERLPKLQAESKSKNNRLSIVVPGSQIPWCFKFCVEGSSITIGNPDSYYNKNKFVGFAICSVFQVRKHPPTVKSYHSSRTHVLQCVMKENEYSHLSYSASIEFDVESGQAVSDHVWLYYWSKEEWYDGCSTFSFSSNSNSGAELEVKKFGIHPVYVDEAEEFNKTA